MPMETTEAALDKTFWTEMCKKRPFKTWKRLQELRAPKLIWKDINQTLDKPPSLFTRLELGVR